MSKNQPKKTREEIVEEIAAKVEWDRKLEEQSSPIPDENLPEITRLWDEREKIIEWRDQVANRQERAERDIVFFEIHKKLLRAYGLKPCALEDCTRWLTGGQRKYCSDSCRGKERARRARKRDPNVQKRAQLKYLKCLEKEGDLKQEK